MKEAITDPAGSLSGGWKLGWGDGKGARELGRRVFLPELLPFLHSSVVFGVVAASVPELQALQN